MLTRLARKLRFLPLGIFWGAVAAVLSVDNFSRTFIVGDVEPVNWMVDWRSIFIILGPAIFACLIATILGNASLRWEFSPLRWSINWVVIGVSSCVGGVAISGLVFSLLYNIWWIYHYPLESSSNLYSAVQLILGATFFGWFFVSGILIESIIVQSLVLASSSLPVALVVRRVMRGAG